MRINNLLLCYIDYGAKDINTIIYKHVMYNIIIYTVIVDFVVNHIYLGRYPAKQCRI